jgi:nicotinamide-nucleotide amidase
VGLAAHPGQTDVRITAKANTEAEADELIAPVEADLRWRLGVALYGVEKETVPEVVGRLLEEKSLKLAVIDTLTEGQLVREMVETGYGHLITTNLQAANLAQALQAVGLETDNELPHADGFTLASALAKAIAPTDGVGLALLGPLDDGVNDNLTFVAVYGDTLIQEVKQRGRMRRFQEYESDYIRRWLVTQGLDWVRRAVLGQLTSPVDWQS